MEIEEKMKICFNDELMGNKILTEDEKKVLASLMYSYQICKEAKDNIIIRAMSDLRRDIKISNNAMYDAIRNLESLYHMIERTAGESRGKEKSSIASKFKLNFDAILHPPKEPVKFDFSKLIKSSETSINTVDIDTDIVIDTVTDIDINNDIDKNINTESNIDNDVNTIIDLNNNIDSNLNTVINSNNNNDVVFENEIIDNKVIDYSIYKNRETWNKSLPDEMNQSYYEKELLIFQLSQLHDIDSIEKKLEEIEIKLRRGNNEIFKKKTRYILNEKSKELGFKFTTIL